VVYIQENISWTVGFAVPALVMLIAIVVFMAGSPRYKHVRPRGSPLARIVDVSRTAWKRMKAEQVQRQRGAHPEEGNGDEEYVEETEPLVSRGEDAREGVDSPALAGPASGRHWLDYALACYSAEQVNEVRLVYGMLPVFFATILYWTIYMQMGSFFVVQGSMMDRQVGTGSFEVPAASLAVIDTVAIVGLIPVYDMLFEPMLRRVGRPMTTLKRIGWGLVICSWSMMAAALVEHERLRAAQDGRLLSIWYQIPQYVLVGASEIFASVGTMEFFYDRAPEAMRSCSSALQLLSVCIGSYLSSLLVVLVQWLSSLGGGPGWLPADLDQGRLDSFFALLAGLMAMNVLLFVWISKRFY